MKSSTAILSRRLSQTVDVDHAVPPLEEDRFALTVFYEKMRSVINQSLDTHAYLKTSLKKNLAFSAFFLFASWYFPYFPFNEQRSPAWQDCPTYIALHIVFIFWFAVLCLENTLNNFSIAAIAAQENPRSTFDSHETYFKQQLSTQLILIPFASALMLATLPSPFSYLTLPFVNVIYQVMTLFVQNLLPVAQWQNVFENVPQDVPQRCIARLIAMLPRSRTRHDSLMNNQLAAETLRHASHFSLEMIDALLAAPSVPLFMRTYAPYLHPLFVEHIKNFPEQWKIWAGYQLSGVLAATGAVSAVELAGLDFLKSARFNEVCNKINDLFKSASHEVQSDFLQAHALSDSVFVPSHVYATSIVTPVSSHESACHVDKKSDDEIRKWGFEEMKCSSSSSFYATSIVVPTQSERPAHDTHVGMRRK